ncbi:MAG TPA: hypothetical protein VGS00_07040 [Thermoanaerobaculia bacterium]|nr:hypothetical protein [Thermoanaerobaculia bacterium]
MTLRNHQGGNDAPEPRGLAVQGPLIDVTLSPHPADAEAIERAGGKPESIERRLLVDTGASRTCIEDRIAHDLYLIPVRFDLYFGISGKPAEYPVYRMSIGIPMKEDQSAPSHQAVFLADVVGMPAPPHPTPHVGLLGRDFLQHVRLVYDGPKGGFEIIDYRHEGVPLESLTKAAP